MSIIQEFWNRLFGAGEDNPPVPSMDDEDFTELLNDMLPEAEPAPEPSYSYVKIQFTRGLDCQAYQKINLAGQLVGYVNLAYEPLDIPEITGSYVIQGE